MDLDPHSPSSQGFDSHQPGAARPQRMASHGDQQIWTIARWMERRLPDDGEIFATRQFRKAMASGNSDGAAIWLSVSSRLHQLHEIAKI